MNNKFRNGFKHIYFSLLSFCGLTTKLNLNGRNNFHYSVHNYSIQTQQTQLTQRRPFLDQPRLKQVSNDCSNNSNEPADIELALVSDQTDNNNNTNNTDANRHLEPQLP